MLWIPFALLGQPFASVVEAIHGQFRLPQMMVAHRPHDHVNGIYLKFVAVHPAVWSNGNATWCPTCVAGVCLFRQICRNRIRRLSLLPFLRLLVIELAGAGAVIFVCV